MYENEEKKYRGISAKRIRQSGGDIRAWVLQLVAFGLGCYTGYLYSLDMISFTGFPLLYDYDFLYIDLSLFV